MHSFTPQQLEAIQALSSGRTAAATADALGIHRTTIHHWCRNIPEFRDALAAAKQSRIDLFREKMNELAAPSLAILHRIIHDESAPLALRIRTALSILKFVTTPEKSSAPKQPPAESGIHHNSSLSSAGESEEELQPDMDLQTPRNAPCPCGSQLKYKRCCGRNAPPVLREAA